MSLLEMVRFRKKETVHPVDFDSAWDAVLSWAGQENGKSRLVRKTASGLHVSVLDSFKLLGQDRFVGMVISTPAFSPEDTLRKQLNAGYNKLFPPDGEKKNKHVPARAVLQLRNSETVRAEVLVANLGVQVIHYPDIEGAVGAYSMAVQFGDKVMLAGHAPNVPQDATEAEGYPVTVERGKKYTGDLLIETRIVLANIERTMRAVEEKNPRKKITYDHALIFVTNAAEAQLVVDQWRKHVEDEKAKVSVVVANLPGMNVEIMPCATLVSTQTSN